tara:strand:+ start:141552 stop:144704 length:3153 start_codon:yes stop_codon:yes gene_type:complete
MSKRPDLALVNYKLFSDKPEKVNLKFGHETISKWLLDIILHSPEQYRIGITRKLGTGKSTLVNSITTALEKDHTYHVVCVDVWKLDEISSRRNSIIKIATKLKLSEKDFDELEEEIYGNISKPSKVEPISHLVNGFSIVQWLFMSIATSFCFFLMFFLFGDDKTLLGKVGISFLIFVVTFSVRLVDKTFITVQKTFNRPPLIGAEEFEKSLDFILSKTKAKKVLLIFDNIDRADFDRTKEILTGISAFFDQDEYHNKDLKILVPFADGEQDELNAITVQKLFDIVIPIPELVPEDLTVYTKEKLTDSGWVNSKKELAELISFGPYRTPREIKHYINKFITKYNLASLMEKEKEVEMQNNYLKEGVITKHPLTFGKLLIMEDIFPGIVASCVKQNYTIQDMFNLTKIKNASNEFPEKMIELIEFINATIDVPRDCPLSPDPFLYFKGADEILEVPGAHDVSEALSLRNDKKVKEYISEKGTIENLISILNYTFKRFKNNNLRIKNTILTVLKSFDEAIESKDLRFLISNEIESRPQIVNDIEINQLNKLTPEEEGNIENLVIWEMLDKLFNDRISSDTEEGEDYSDWIESYLSHVIQQKGGSSRVGLTASKIGLKYMLTEKMVETMGNQFPGPYVNEEQTIEIFNLVASNQFENKYPDFPVESLEEFVKEGVKNSSPTIKQKFVDFLNAYWKYLSAHINTDEFDTSTFDSFIYLIKGIEIGDKITDGEFRTLFTNLNNSHSIFDKKFNSGFSVEVLTTYIELHSKLKITGHPNMRKKFESYLNSISVDKFKEIEDYYTSWSWAEIFNDVGKTQLITKLSDRDFLEYLMVKSDSKMAGFLVTSLDSFKDNLTESIIDKLPKMSKTHFSLEDLFSEAVKRPLDFDFEINKSFIDRLDIFEDITKGDDFPDYCEQLLEQGNDYEICELLTGWLLKNNEGVFKSVADKVKKGLDEYEASWDMNKVCNFYIISKNLSNITNTALDDVIDVAIQRGIEEGESRSVAECTAEIIIDIYEQKTDFKSKKKKIFKEKVKESELIEDKFRDENSSRLKKIK